MKILVTGGAGYLGSTLVRLLLEAGHEVRVLDALIHNAQTRRFLPDHLRFEFLQGDVRDPKARKKSLHDISGVVHLAAIVGDPACARNPEEARDVNLTASADLLKDCSAAGVQRFVFASTCSNYGRMEEAEDAYMHEASPLSPLSVYAETKVAFEKMLLDGGGREGLWVTPLRFATLYGVSPSMRFDLTVNEFTRDMLTKKHLVVFGAQSWRPYVHVADAARAICAVLETAQAIDRQVFNVGATSQNFRKIDLVNLIRRHAPDACVELTPKTDDLRNYRVCFDRISQELSFVTEHTVEDGIAEVARLIQSGRLEDCHGGTSRN